MQDRKSKIAFLKDVQAGRITVLPKARVDHRKHLDLSPSNIPNISREQLVKYLEYAQSLSFEQQKELPFTAEQASYALFDRIGQEAKIRVLKWFNPDVLSTEASTGGKFTFENLENFTLHEIAEEVEKMVGRKFNPQTDYPEVSKQEMMQFIKAAKPVEALTKEQYIKKECSKQQQSI